MRRKLKILITNLGLTIGTGTEIVVRDLALGLRDLGHQPMIYAPRTGELFDEMARTGIPVVAQLDQLTDTPDIIHGHHHIETVQACDQFPDAPAIFVVHGRFSYFDLPPDHRQIRRYIAVDYFCMERIENANLGLPLCVIPNSVDLRLFQQRLPLPAKPERALIFSNYARADSHVEAVAAACRSRGIALDMIGAGVGNLVRAPEAVLGQYDLVFAKGRAALESLAVGASVILCDTNGLGEMVDTSTVKGFRRWNFGMRLLNRPITRENIIAEIDRYDVDDARIVSDYIRARTSLSNMIDHYVQLYREVVSEHAAKAGKPVPNDNPYRAIYKGSYRNIEHLLLLNQNHVEAQQAAKLERSVSLPLDIRPRQIELTVLEVPQQVERGKPFTALVQLDNQSAYVLSEFPPYPVRLSYHWLAESGERLPEKDWIRTFLQVPIQPQQMETLVVQAKAPEEPGTYRLRVTLLQEWYREWDAPPFRIFADASIAVV